jgi:hypothetical protein
MTVTPETHVWYRIDRHFKNLVKANEPLPGFDSVLKGSPEAMVEKTAEERGFTLVHF